jgi:hypothetical protein
MSKALTELIAPAPDCLVCHSHTALEEQFLDVAQAQLKAKIPAYGATDDRGLENGDRDKAISTTSSRHLT